MSLNYPGQHEPALTLAGNQCELHRYHAPEPLITHVHHVWPLGDGGPDEPTNKIKVCPTGHYNVHRYMDAVKKAAPTFEATGAWPKGLPRPARAELKIARRGLAAQGVPYPGQRNKLLGLIRRRAA